MKRLELELITRNAFNTQRSYEAALYAATIINRLRQFSKQGYLILNYENVVKLDAKIVLDDEGQFQYIVIGDHEKANVMLVGDESVTCAGKRGEPDSEKIYCTKKTIREFFKLWRVCQITNVLKAVDIA